jgi:hypothetical protein
MNEDYKYRMHDFGKIMTAHLDQVKQEVFQHKSGIDRDFPAWPARRAEFPDDYLKHEARREFFVTVVTLLENAQLSYVLLRDHLTDDTWWSERLSDVRDDKCNSVLHEYAIMVKWFLLHGLFMAVEETLRAIQRAAPDEFPVPGRFKSIAEVTSAVLGACELQEYDELFHLTRLTRNTIHTNGVFLPEDEADQQVVYADQTFSFTLGKILDWLNDQCAVWFVEELVRAMDKIVRSSKFSRVDYCPRTQVPGS